MAKRTAARRARRHTSCASVKPDIGVTISGATGAVPGAAEGDFTVTFSGSGR